MDGRNGTASPRASVLGQRSEIILSLGLLGVLIVLLVPLPPVLLDMLLAGNLAITILLLLLTVNVTQALDISVFPSLLLLMTLYRLSLNVATTRLILLDGDAGKIVATFGGFVVGGNLIVGLVIFLILIIIQFIVITKGAGRVSEVAARFTLDAMPGKQMAIDAELNAGSIDDKEARRRREHLAQESEFYGAMDGAGKFVRGDAIAGLVITGVNLLGGVVLGVTNGMTIAEAITRYSVLTVGDGLVSQIPALIIATAAGILVTKATSKLSLGNEIGSQLLANGPALKIGALVLGIVAFTPGLPKLPFFLLSGGLYLIARRAAKEARAPVTEPPAAEKSEAAKPEEHVEEFLQHDRACVEIGVRLIPLVDGNHGKGLADRIGSLRTDLTRKFGIWIPAIRMRDSLRMSPEQYRVLVGGREVARSEIRPGKMLAISPGESAEKLEGEPATDPAFGLPAVWIPSHMQHRAEMKGYTVVDATTVLITHLGEVLRKHSHELLSREDLRKLLDRVREHSPTVVEELKPDLIRMGDLHQVLVLLLQERVPLTNLTRILEVVVQLAPHWKSAVEIADRVRLQLGRDIFDRLRDDQGRVAVMVLEPRLEARLRESLRDRQLMLSHDSLEHLVAAISQKWEKSQLESREVTLLTDGELRRPIRQVVERAIPDLAVTSYNEVPNDMSLDIRDLIRLDEVYRKETANVTPSSSPSAPVTAGSTMAAVA
jgi:flagellar biosynthesis protein FlhA